MWIFLLLLVLKYIFSLIFLLETLGWYFSDSGNNYKIKSILIGKLLFIFKLKEIEVSLNNFFLVFESDVVSVLTFLTNNVENKILGFP